MITKSEEENLMNEALGRRISDYLTKPVNPSQVFLAIKKVLEGEALQRDQKTRDYVAEFNRILSCATATSSWRDWLELYRRMARLGPRAARDAEREPPPGAPRPEGAAQPRVRALRGVALPRWVEQKPRERPPLSVDIFPRLRPAAPAGGTRVVFVVIDCMRLDQWRRWSPFSPLLRGAHRALLLDPADGHPLRRNAIFSGLYPLEIARRHPDWWLENVGKETGKNRYEKELLRELLQREGLSAEVLRYQKVYTADEAAELKKKVTSQMSTELLALVFNFLDMLAHGQFGRRSSTSWRRTRRRFAVPSHPVVPALGPLRDPELYARQNVVVVITTDHGSVQCKKSTLVFGNRDTSTSIRYKFGDNLVCDEREAIHIKKPQDYMLPQEALTKTYVLARENYYFVYPTNQHHYERQFRGTFQHGGISLEEMILPVATLTPR